MRSAENYDPKGVDFIDLMESEDLSKMTPLMYAGFEGLASLYYSILDFDLLAVAVASSSPTPTNLCLTRGAERCCVSVVTESEAA